MATANTSKDRWSVCYGIVKSKRPANKTFWTLNAKDYESAIRQAKKDARSNYESYDHPATLFYNGHAVGWVFSDAGTMIYISKDQMQRLGLIPKSRA